MKPTTRIILAVTILIMPLSLAACSSQLNNVENPETNAVVTTPVEVSWETAIETLETGKVIEVVQSHNLEVVMTLDDGSKMKTVEPLLDQIFREIELCGDICAEIALITE